MKFFLSFFCLCFFFPSIIVAQEISESKDPVEISADGTLEWLQNKNQYVANGNVEAKQGDVTIFADQLIADYVDNESGGNVEITNITAIGNVRIKNTDSTAQGDKATYDINTTEAILTGKNLKLTTPDQVITATKSMTYNSTKGQAKAIGNAKIVSDGNTLSAPTITANFKKDNIGKQTLSRAEANGGVTIKTPDEVLTGNKGIYNANNDTAEIIGNVKIIRGPNILEGARGEVNLKTNVSKMFGAPNSGQRVKGVFFPGSNKE
jgi:lipopolysaccharide export system protein LptA